MAVIKKFRIKSFKEEESYIELKNISMFYDKREILNNLSYNIWDEVIEDYLLKN